MDGNTEPLIAVIGRPIAGNPSQFAIECVLRSLELDCRVTSFDVEPKNLNAALCGLEVLGFQGVLADEFLASHVGEWCKNRDPENSNGAPIHCLFRCPDDKEKLIGHDSHSAWLVATSQAHFQQYETTITDTLWLGARDETFPEEMKSENDLVLSTRTPTIESVQQANLIVLAPGPKKDVLLDANEWPQDDGSTLVLDLTSGHDELSQLQQLGYTTLSYQARRNGTIQQSLLRWTGQLGSETIISEAIEEYLGV